MKLTIWLLSSLMLLQSTSIGLGDVLRMNELIEHAYLHQEEFGDSIWMFVSKHYGKLQQEHIGSNPHNSTDHNKLPFQHNCCTHASMVAMIHESSDPQLEKWEWSDKEEKFFHYKAPRSKRFISGIFQPPKQA